MLMSQFSPNNPNPKIDIISNINKKPNTTIINGATCQSYGGNVIANKGKNFTSVDFFTDTQYTMPEVYKCYILNADVPGMITRCTSDSNGKAFLIGTMHSISATKLVDVNEREVSDDEMKVPPNIKIDVQKNINNLYKLYRENHKFLKKNNMTPPDNDLIISYNINDNWNF